MVISILQAEKGASPASQALTKEENFWKWKMIINASFPTHSFQNDNLDAYKRKIKMMLG